MKVNESGWNGWKWIKADKMDEIGWKSWKWLKVDKISAVVPASLMHFIEFITVIFTYLYPVHMTDSSWAEKPRRRKSLSDALLSCSERKNGSSYPSTQIIWYSWTKLSLLSCSIAAYQYAQLGLYPTSLSLFCMLSSSDEKQSLAWTKIILSTYCLEIVALVFCFEASLDSYALAGSFNIWQTHKNFMDIDVLF